MKLTDAQRKTLYRLAEGDCEYFDVMKAGGSGVTLRWLTTRGLAEEYKVYGTRFWKITADGLNAIK